MIRAPDVVFLPQRGIAHGVKPLPRVKDRTYWLVPANDLFSQNSHDSWGIFAAVGYPFQNKEVSGMGIADVMPTMLHTIGLPVPADLDGRVIEEVFSGSFRSAHAILRSELLTGGTEPAKTDHGYSLAEEEAMRKHLEDLGYM